MENFNVFEPMLKQGIEISKNCIILGKKGDENKYRHDYTFFGGEKQYYGKDTKRKTESEKMSDASVLVYYKDTETITWKSTYIDRKGVYFKHRRDKIYIKTN